MRFTTEHRDLDTGYTRCHGCALCTLVCPVFQHTGDLRRTPQGFCKALQASAQPNGAAVFDCMLCGACEAVCPESIELMPLLLALRRAVVEDGYQSGFAVDTAPDKTTESIGGQGTTATLLLPGRALRADAGRLAGVHRALGGSAKVSLVADAGDDILAMLIAGQAVPAMRLQGFLDALGSATKLIVEDGVLMVALRQWLPGRAIAGLGYELSQLVEVQGQLLPTDLYVIDAAAYHANHATNLPHYDELRRQSGCDMNLDLQRLAVPCAGSASKTFDMPAQARWLLKGRRPARIVTESLADRDVIAKQTPVPVLHLSDLLAAGSTGRVQQEAA